MNELLGEDVNGKGSEGETQVRDARTETLEGPSPLGEVSEKRVYRESMSVGGSHTETIDEPTSLEEKSMETSPYRENARCRLT